MKVTKVTFHEGGHTKIIYHEGGLMKEITMMGSNTGVFKSESPLFLAPRKNKMDTHSSCRHIRQAPEVQVLLAVVQALDDPLTLCLALQHGQAGQVATEVVLELQLFALPAGAHHQLSGVDVVALVQWPVINLFVVGLIGQE